MWKKLSDSELLDALDELAGDSDFWHAYKSTRNGRLRLLTTSNETREPQFKTFRECADNFVNLLHDLKKKTRTNWSKKWMNGPKSTSVGYAMKRLFLQHARDQRVKLSIH